MATHERQPDDPKRPLHTYVCNAKHDEHAKVCECFLGNFSNLKVWRVQYPDSKVYTCWYAGFNHSFNYEEERYLLNFEIRPKNIKIEFRHPEFLPKNTYDALKNNLDWKTLLFTEYPEKYLKELVSVYLNTVKPVFDSNREKFHRWHPKIFKN